MLVLCYELYLIFLRAVVQGELTAVYSVLNMLHPGQGFCDMEMTMMIYFFVMI